MMKTSLSIALILTSGPALADVGGHLHPHGSEIWFAVLGAAAAVGAFGLVRAAARVAARKKAGK